jgi:hypothetical protein
MFLTLREEHRLRMFENRVLRRWDGLTGDWRKLHDLYSSTVIIRINNKNYQSRRMR